MKRIFLTGASSGIGLAIAKSLAARGDEVWGTSRTPDRIPKLPHLRAVRLDLSDPNSIESAFGDALTEAQHFDVLINNAGRGHFGAAELLSTAEITDQFQVLFFAHVRLMQLALAEMRRRNSGLIINVTSLAAFLPVPFMAAYNAAKAAMAAFTMSIQLELGDSNVKIVDLQPGDISTGFNDSVIKGEHDPQYERSARKSWQAVERNMKAAPPPDLVARRILKLIDQNTPPPLVTVGDIFQTRIAPLIFRLLPQRIRIWGLRKYYGI